MPGTPADTRKQCKVLYARRASKVLEQELVYPSGSGIGTMKKHKRASSEAATGHECQQWDKFMWMGMETTGLLLRKA